MILALQDGTVQIMQCKCHSYAHQVSIVQRVLVLQLIVHQEHSRTWKVSRVRISASQEPTASTTAGLEILHQMQVLTVKLDISAMLHSMTIAIPSLHSTLLAPKLELSAEVGRFARLVPLFQQHVLQAPTN